MAAPNSLAQTIAGLQALSGQAAPAKNSFDDEKFAALMFGLQSAFAKSAGPSLQPLGQPDFGNVFKSLQMLDRTRAADRLSKQNALTGQINTAVSIQKLQAQQAAAAKEAQQEAQASKILLGGGSTPITDPSTDLTSEDAGTTPTKGLLDLLPAGKAQGIKAMLAGGNHKEAVKEAFRAIEKGELSKQAKSTLGKIKQDYQKGVYGPVGSPEALKLEQAAIAKATNISNGSIVKDLADVMNNAEAKRQAIVAVNESQKLRGRATAAANLAILGSRANDIRASAEAAGGTVLGTSASISRFVSGLKSQVNVILGKGNHDISPKLRQILNTDKSDDATEKQISQFGAALQGGTGFDWDLFAGKSAAFRSTMLRMAVMQARVDEVGRLSDADIERALKEVGADSQSEVAAMAAMVTSVRNSIKRVQVDISFARPEVAKRLENITGEKFMAKVNPHISPAFRGFLGGGDLPGVTGAGKIPTGGGPKFKGKTTLAPNR